MLKNKYCRFCEVPLHKTNPKLNNLTSQLIQYHYIDEFYFYFSRPINEMLAASRSAESLAFKEIQLLTSKTKLGFAFYNSKDWADVVSKRTGPKHRLPAPVLIDHNLREKLFKDNRAKDNQHWLAAEDEDEKRRYLRRKQQLPLRDGFMLQGGRQGFVDAESFESKLFDIYAPEFSSMIETQEPPMKSILMERIKKGAYPQATEVESGASLRPTTKLPVPLLWLRRPPAEIFKDSAILGETSGRVKPLNDPAKSKGLGGSENQSTQFSISCVFNKNARRKQVLEDSKRNASRQRSNSKVTAKQFAASPKPARKKRGARDQSLKEGKKPRKSKDFEVNKNLMATTNSLFNSRSWNILKSWDQFMGGRFRDGSTVDATTSRGDQINSKREGGDRKEKKAQVIINENLRQSKTQLPIKALGNLSSRKAALSPRVTERMLSQRDQTYKSFKEKCSFKETKQRGYKKPLWIGVPDQRDKKSIREILFRPEGIIGFRTQGCLSSAKNEFDKKVFPLELGTSEVLKKSKSRIHRSKEATQISSNSHFKFNLKDRTISEDIKDEKSQERVATKVSCSGVGKPCNSKKKGLSIKDWKKVAGEAGAKTDFTSSNHFLTSRSVTRRGKDNNGQTQIATERRVGRDSKSKVRRGYDYGSNAIPSSRTDC